MEPANRTRRGRFIVLEGIDGSGTTTQVKRLGQALSAEGHEVVCTCEPTSERIGAFVRSLLQAPDGPPPHFGMMALLFAADRLDHLQRTVLPALDAGKIVISDRYDLSSYAYQSATADGDATDVLAWLRQLNRYAQRPDLTLVLDVPPEVAEARRGARGEAAELFEKAELQRRLAGIYATAEELVPQDRLVHVVADAALESVAEAVLQQVQPLLAG